MASRPVSACWQLTKGNRRRFIPAMNISMRWIGICFRPIHTLLCCRSLIAVMHCVTSKSVQAARQNFLGSGWSEAVLGRLPPLVVYAENSVVAKADEARMRNESWEQFDPQMKVVSRTDRNLEIRDDQDAWDLTIVARGDFNRDGLEDQVVIACDIKRFGSGGLCLPLVLTASSPARVMTLISSLSEPYNIVSLSTGAR